MSASLVGTYASSAAATSHTVSLSGKTSGKDVLVFFAAFATPTRPSPWTEVGSFLWASGGAYLKVWKLAASDADAVSSLVIALNGSRSLSALVVEDYIDAAGSVYATFSVANPNASTPSQQGTGLHTTTHEEGVAVYGIGWTGAGSDSTFDVASYDQSFAELGDSGLAVGTSPVRVFLAKKDSVALSNQGVTATYGSARPSTTPTGVGGVFAFEEGSAPSNVAPSNTTAPAITGTAVTGNVLTCSTGTWTGSPTPTYAYQWKRSGTAISGATSSTYTLVSGDEGASVKCSVTATNSVGSASADSNTVTPSPAPTAPSNSTAPAITGSAVTGHTLTVSDGTWVGSPTGYTYQWKRAGAAISAATANTYVLVTADEGTAIKCAVTATNSAGSTSADSNTVTPSAPVTGTTNETEGLNRFFPEDYGAIGDGVNDDTGPINDCIAAAFAAGRADGSNYAEVFFSATEYLLSSATLKGAPGYGNAQIPLPVVDEDDQKFTLVLKGSANATAWNHWNQDNPQKTGPILRSTLAPGTSPDSTWGAYSVIGGPTPLDATLSTAGIPAGFSNMLLVVDGITVMAPANPGLVALNLKRVAMCDIKSFSALSNQTTAQMTASKPTNDQGIGIVFPKVGNNDNVTIGTYNCAGFYYGLVLSDHLTANRIGILFAKVGIYLSGFGGDQHGASILNLSVEACDTIIKTSVTSGAKFPIFIGMLNTETGTGTNFDDAANGLVGQVYFTNNTDGAPTVSGAKNLKITDLNRYAGAVTAPSIPSSGTAITNPFFRDAAVTLGSGVTDVEVDGQALGVGAGATVIVPNNRTIKPTHSAGSWKWTLL